MSPQIPTSLNALLECLEEREDALAVDAAADLLTLLLMQFLSGEVSHRDVEEIQTGLKLVARRMGA